MIELHLPFPPSANSIWRRAGTRIHKSTQYSAWLREAGWQVVAQKAGTIKGPYSLSISAVRPDKRMRDLDNLTKSVSDLLKNVGVIEDDHLAQTISLRWVASGEGIIVCVEPARIEHA